MYKRIKIFLPIILAVVLVLSGVIIVNNPMPNGCILQFGEKAEAAVDLFYYSKYEAVSSYVKPKSTYVTYTKGALIQEGIKAAVGTYPDNGVHTDGFWYVKGANVYNNLETWTQKASGPAYFKPTSSVAINGKMYVFGIANGDVYSKAMWEYNPETNSWAQKSSCPGYFSSGTASVEINGKIYIYGYTNLKYLWEYNPITDTWTQKASNPDSYLGGFSAVAFNNKMYIYESIFNGMNYTNTMWEFNPLTNIWTAKIGENSATSQVGSAVAINGKIYIFGRKDSYSSSTFLLEYNPATNTLIQKTGRDTYISGFSAVVINNKMYIYGVSVPNFDYLSSLLEYNPTTDTWAYRTCVTSNRSGSVAAVINGKMYVFGGNNGTGGSTAYLNDLWEYCYNSSPSISTTSPSQNETYSTLQPTMNLSGTIYDPDDGDSETIYYRIDGSAGQAGTTAATLTANGSNQSFSTSINVAGLAEGTHNIYVWAKDCKGVIGAEYCSTFKIDNTAPTASAPTLTASSSSQITVQPNAFDSSGLNSSTPYKYNRNGTDITAWQTGDFIDSGLTPNTQYTYKYMARDSALNTSGYSALVSKYTLAETPSIAVNEFTSYTMDLSISDTNPSNTQYQIMVGSNYVTSSGTLSSTAQWITLENKKITVTGLSPNTTYTVKAKARNAENVETSYSSSVSNTILVAQPNTPTGLSVAETTKTSIKVVWNVVVGATSYDIIVDENAENIQNVITNSFIINGLTAETSHTFSVRAKNGGNPSTSNWSSAITAWTHSNPPTGFTVTPTSNSISLSWNGVASSAGNEILGYDIMIDDGTIIENGTSTTYNHTGLTPNSLHSYKVRARSSAGGGEYSDAINAYTLSNLPSSGSIDTSKITNTSILASWQSNGNPEGTQYSIAAFDENDVLLKQNAWTTNISDALTGLTPNTVYKIKVKARNADEKETEWYEIPNSVTTLSNTTSPATFVPITTTYTAACTAGNAFSLVLKLKNMKSFTGRTFTITYNTSDITSVTDLCKMTYKKETVAGAIAGTGITIVQNIPGTIVFTIEKDIPEGKCWSGILDIIVFKAAVSGQVTLTCKVE